MGDGDSNAIKIDLSEYPRIIRSFSFDCLNFNNIILRDVHATVDINGVLDITFLGFDSPGHV